MCFLQQKISRSVYDMLVMLCFGVIAYAMPLTTLLTILFSLDLERVNLMNCLWHGHVDVGLSMIAIQRLYLHISSLQSNPSLQAPLIIGCDVWSMTKETLANHGNEEVIDVNQDPLGVHVKKVRMDGDQENHRSPMGRHRSSTKHGCGSREILEVNMVKRFVNELRAPPCLQDVPVDASYTIERE
ncbi:unnamed protein product [Musa acuminata subsp. burmannicoides]